MVTLVIQLVQVPLFIAFWGVEKYGEWLVLTGVPLLFVLADAGVAQASANKCTMEMGRQSFEDARNTLKTARAYVTLVALLVAVVGLLLAVVVDWTALLKLGTVPPNSAKVVILLIACYVAFSLQGGYYGAWLRASDQTPVHAFIEGSTRVFDLCTVALALFVGGSFITVAVALLLSAAVCRLTHSLIARRLSSHQLRSPGKATLGQLCAVLKPSAGFIGISLTQTLTVQGGIQVLNQISNQQTVVLFNTVRILVRTLVLLGGAVSNALRPELARLVGEGREYLAATFSKRITITTQAIGVAVYVMFVLFGPLAIEMWTDSKITASHVVFGMVGLHAILHVTWLMPATLRFATNRHVRLAAAYAISALTALGFWVLAKGIIDPMIGAAFLLALPELAALVIISTKPNRCQAAGQTRIGT